MATPLGNPVEDHPGAVPAAAVGHGTDTMEQALEKVKAFTLAEALPHLTQPFLVVHGADDSIIPLSHAQQAIEAAGSADKQLVVFDGVDGGAEHCSMDESDPTRQLVADWFEQQL
jgi:pimeloyl-ACP methyl ester carboxylesterase